MPGDGRINPQGRRVRRPCGFMRPSPGIAFVFIIHHSSFIIHHSSFTIHRSSFIVHRSSLQRNIG